MALIILFIAFYSKSNNFKNEINEMRKKIDLLIQKNKEEEYKNLIEKEKIYNDTINILTEKNKILEKENKKLIEKIKNLEKENNKLIEKIKNLEKENKKLIKKNKNEINEMRKINQLLIQKNKEEEYKFIEKEKIYNDTINNLTEQNKNLEKDNKELIEKIKNKEEENKKSNEENKKKQEKKTFDNELLKKPIIGIDFGSSFSGFSILQKKNGRDIEDNNIFTSEITLNKETGEVVEIGKDSIFKYQNNKNNYIYFQYIKMNLDHKKRKNLNPKGDELIYSFFPKEKESIKLTSVIKEYLKKLSEKALKILNGKKRYKYNTYSKNDIKWVVTVPAIWNEHAKQLMKNCAIKAGMSDVLISLEPEAASLTMFDDPNIDDTLKEKDKIFMLIDAGGYTVDITLNQIIDENRNLKQLSPPSGGAFGSMNINKEIYEILEDKFESKFYNFLEKNLDKYDSLKEQIEKIKQSVCNGEGVDNFEFKIENNYDKGWINRMESFESKYGTINYDSNYIYIPKTIIKEIILKQVDKIINHIQKLYYKFDYITIDQLVITGGFSNCKILKKKLERTFIKTVINQLNNPEKTIVKGAALYALKPNQIISRIAPYTIGISSYQPQRAGYECKNIKIINNKIRCKYFDIFIKKGQEIKNNLSINESFIPLKDHQNSVDFHLYYSNLINPVFINENVKEIAYFTIEVKETYLPREKREIIVEMKFSSCITVTAKNVNSGNEVSINANYYDINDEDK